MFTGCAVQQTSPNAYRSSEALRTGSVEVVTVIRVRQVTIVDSDGYTSANSGIPGIVGAVVGGLLGARVIGGGNGRYIAGALSGTVSGIATQAVASYLNRRNGLEVIVRKENGNQIAVTQDADQQFVTGQQLYLVGSGGGYRLTR